MASNLRPSSHEEVQPQRSAEQLALIHAAMMEELGIGRKDTLPLQDKGPAISVHKAKANRIVNPNDPVAGWHSVHLDNVDPALEEIDSIADGQLYRLRRGASNGSAGRARGGMASRGGHAFTTGRGGHANRGNHIPMLKPQNFYDVARRDVRHNARIEVAINRLRDEPSRTIPAHKKEKSKQGDDQQTSKIPQPNRSSTRSDEDLIRTRYCNLASPSQFVSHWVSEAQPASRPKLQETAQKIASPLLSSTVEEQKGILPPTTKPAMPLSLVQKGLQPPNPAAPSQIPVASSASTNANQLQAMKPKVGLAGSMWATPAIFEHVTQVPQARFGNTFVPYQRQPIVQKDASESSHMNKTVKEDDIAPTTESAMPTMPKEGLSSSKWSPESMSLAPLRGQTPADDTEPATAAQTMRSISVNEQPIDTFGGLSASIWASGTTLFKPLVTFRDHPVKAHVDEGGELLGSLKLMKTDNKSPCILALDLQGGDRVLGESIVRTATFEVNGATIKYKTNNEEAATSAWFFTFQLPHIARAVYNVVRGDSHRPQNTGESNSGASEPDNLMIMPHNSRGDVARENPLHRDVDRQFSEMTTTFSNELISTEIASEHGYRSDVNHRISSRTFSLLNSLEGTPNLVEIDEEEEREVEKIHGDEQVAIPSALIDLATLNNDVITQHIFQAIDSHFGSFLDHLFKIVGLDEFGPNASPEEVMGSQPHVNAAERLLGEFLGFSETFTRLTGGAEEAYVTDLGWKVLAKALMERGRLSVPEANASVTDAPFILIGGSSVTAKADTPKTPSRFNAALRQNYSIEDLMSMRPLALEVKYALLPPEETKIQPQSMNRPNYRAKTGSNDESVMNWQSFARTGTSVESSQKTQAQLSSSPDTEVNMEKVQQSNRSKSLPVDNSSQSWQQKFSTAASRVNPTKAQLISTSPSSAHSEPRETLKCEAKPPIDSQTYGQISRPTPQNVSHQEISKPHMSAGSWATFAKTESTNEPEVRKTKSAGLRGAESTLIMSPTISKTPIKITHKVEVYSPRELTASTCTSGWKSWAKETSGLEPAVRPPNLITPEAVTSTDGWRNFATMTSEDKPEKTKQRNPAADNSETSKSIPHIVSQLPPHLRKSKPVTGTKPTEMAEMTSVPSSEPTTRVKGTMTSPSNIATAASSSLIASNSNGSRHSNRQEDDNIQSRMAPLKAPGSASAWRAFSGLKPTTLENNVEIVASTKSNLTAVTASVKDPPLFRPIMTGLNGPNTSPEESAPQEVVIQAKKENVPLQRPRGHVPTASEVGRLGEAFKALNLVGNLTVKPQPQAVLPNDSQQILKLEDARPDHNFLPVLVAAKKNPMAMSHDSLKRAPGLSASKFATNSDEPVVSQGRNQSTGSEPQIPRSQIEEVEKPIKFKDRPQKPFPQPRPPRSYVNPETIPSINFSNQQLSMIGADQSTLLQGGLQTPTPIPVHAATSQMQTFLLQDATGQWVEVTGYAKAANPPPPATVSTSNEHPDPELLQAQSTPGPSLSTTRQGENVHAAIQRRLMQSLIYQSGPRSS